MRFIAFFLGAFAMPMKTWAINFDNIDTCPVTTINGVGCFTTPSLDPNEYILNLIANPANPWSLMSMFGALLLTMLLYYPIRLILGSRDDTTITEVRMAYAHAIFGAAIVGGAFWIADTFTLDDGLLVNPTSFNPVILNAIIFFKALLATLLVAVIVIHAYRMIFSQSDTEVAAARSRLVYAMIGSAIVILANAFVNSFFGINIGIVADEVIGVIFFLLTILGALAALGIIIAGILLVMGTSESVKDTSKRIIIACAVSLAVTLASYGLVTIFILP